MAITTTPESAQIFGSLLTAQGEMFEQRGVDENKQIQFVKIAIGDANDTYVQPDRVQTSLVHEVARFAVDAVDIIQPKPTDVPILRVQAYLPANVNGIVIRELAAVASYDGGAEYLHAVGNCARIFIPTPTKNAGVAMPVNIEMHFLITSVEPIITFDPGTTATRIWVEQKFVQLQPPSDQFVDGDKTIHTGQLLTASPDKNVKANVTVADDGAIEGTIAGLSPQPKKWMEVDANGVTKLFHAGDRICESAEKGLTIGKDSQIDSSLFFRGISRWALINLKFQPNNTELRFHQCDNAGQPEKKWIVCQENAGVQLYHNDVLAVETGGAPFDGYHLKLPCRNTYGEMFVGAIPTNNSGWPGIEMQNAKGKFTQCFNDRNLLYMYFKPAPSTGFTHYHFITTDGATQYVEAQWSVKKFSIDCWSTSGVSTTKLTTESTEGKLWGKWVGTVTPSDSTLKTDIQSLNGLAKLQLLEPCCWHWKDTDALNDHPTQGFTAESYQKVFPDLVETIQNPPADDASDDPDAPAPPPPAPMFHESAVGKLGIKKDIGSHLMDAYLVDAIKTLAAKNTELENRLRKLEAEILL